MSAETCRFVHLLEVCFLGGGGRGGGGGWERFTFFRLFSLSPFLKQGSFLTEKVG